MTTADHICGPWSDCDCDCMERAYKAYDAVEQKVVDGTLCPNDGKPHEWRDVREEYGADRDGNRGEWFTRRECAKCGEAP